MQRFERFEVRNFPVRPNTSPMRGRPKRGPLVVDFYLRVSLSLLTELICHEYKKKI